jgi:hypothetical protein
MRAFTTRSKPGPRGLLGISAEAALTRISVIFGRYLDDVGVGTRTVAVIRSYPIIIDRTRAQPGNIVTRRVANIQILIPRYVIDKRTVPGHIQAITCRATYAAPLRGEAAGSHVGCL